MKAGKRFTTLFIALCLVLSCIAAFPSAVCAAENDDPMLTKASAAVMLYNRLQNKEIVKTISFNDIDGTESYAEAVLALASLGVVAADAEGNFYPNHLMTRGQFAEMVKAFTLITEGWQAEMDACKGFLEPLNIREVDAAKLLARVYGEEVVPVVAFTPVFNIQNFSSVLSSNSFVEQVNGNLIGFAK